MSIRLAAGKPLAALNFSAAIVRRMRRDIANDNGRGMRSAESSSAMLNAALRHFGRHGLAAARLALDEAKAATAQGDEQTAEFWEGICSMLDRRLLLASARHRAGGKIATPN